MKERLKESFNIIIGILLSISLSSFLIIFSEKSITLQAFFFNSFIVTALYIIFIYSFSFYEMKKIHFIVPRTAILVSLSFLPYAILRTYAESPLEKMTSTGLFLYLIVLSLISIVWGIWEGVFYKDKFKLKEIKIKEIFNFRTIFSIIFLFFVLWIKYNQKGFI